MAGSFVKLIKKLRHFKKGKLSFSQCGEDLMVDNLFAELRLKHINYLDVGSHDPVKLSNTYYFYLKGSHGVLVEPDPSLFRKLRATRGRDICLNQAVSISGKAERKPFYLMRSSTLNTLSKSEAERCAALGHPMVGVIEVDAIPINDIIKTHFSDVPLHFLSVDVEGVDFDIIKSLDLSRYRPVVLCVETITFDTDRKRQRKRTEIAEYLHGQDYLTYADTYINTIFVDRKLWHA